MRFLSFLGIAESVGESIPFVPVSASEFSSPERSKSESLIQALRKAVGVEIYEEAEVVEGEVVELVIDQSKAKVLQPLMFSGMHRQADDEDNRHGGHL